MERCTEVRRGEKVFFGRTEVFAPPGVHAAALDAAARFFEPTAMVLECGPGTGAFTLRLREANYRVTCVGIAPGTFAVPDVTFVPHDLADDLPPALQGAFDAVVATEVIEHLENGYAFFRTAASALRPRGKLIVTTPNVLSAYSRLLFWHSGNVALGDSQLMDDWGHIQVLPAWILGGAARRAGFRVLETRGVGTLRFDTLPRWHSWANRCATLVKLLASGERFPGELTGSNVLMVCEKA